MSQLSQYTILKILSDGAWHEVDRLCSSLELSAAELQVEVAALQTQGLLLEYRDGSGYRLAEPLILLDREQIRAGLSASLRDSLVTFELHPSLDSTNTRASCWLRDGGSGLALFLAEKQVQGRGRRGRSWVSPLARNIYFTVVWPVPAGQPVAAGFSLVTALSVVSGLQACGLPGSGQLRVKWPNDVWLGEAKLAGILLELHGMQADRGHVIIGMGVNVRLPDHYRQLIEQPVTDLFSQGTAAIDRNQLVVAILSSLERNLVALQTGGFEQFRNRWRELDALYGRKVEVSGPRQQLTGVAREWALRANCCCRQTLEKYESVAAKSPRRCGR